MRRCNVGIVAHVDAGKTTTTEQILYQSGRIRTLGRVDAGTAHTDWLEIERTRGISVKSAVTRFHWDDCTVNLIDTPGHIDFSAEVERSLRVLDGVILVISALEGVQAHTETLWRALHEMGIPTLVFVNKMDREGVDAATVVQTLQASLHALMTPIQIPQGQAKQFSGVQSIFPAQPLPTWEPSLRPVVDSLHATLAETDETLLQLYVDGQSLAPTDLERVMTAAIHQCRLFPVLFGASLRGLGITELMSAMTRYLPATAALECSSTPPSGLVFKIERNPVHGRAAYVRMFTGTLHNRDTIHNTTQDLDEKITQIRSVDGAAHQDTGIVAAGDVSALYGLTQTRVGDMLGQPTRVRNLPSLSLPLLTVQVFPEQQQDYSAAIAALQELNAEDPALGLRWIPETHELHITVMGNIQLEVIADTLRNKYKTAVQFSPPSVIYRETLERAAQGFVAYTMPKPCWAILRFDLRPAARGSGLTYTSYVRTDDLLQRYQHEVARRVPEALEQGLLGWQVTDLEVALVEGQHHVWHTHPLDFVVATPMGIMDGLRNGGTYLLEPVLAFRMTAETEYGGKIMSDIARLRAEFDSPVIKNGRIHLDGTIPLATTLDYPLQFAILTGGRGIFSTRFLEYRQSPPDVQASRPRRGVHPLDTARYILSMRSALS